MSESGSLDEAWKSETRTGDVLRGFVSRAVERAESAHPDADITVDGATDVEVVVDTNLDVALAELVEYAIRSQDAAPRVSITVSDRPPDRVSIDVRYAGQPISRNDRQVLNEGIETPLEHCRGLGLWLVKWITENAHGRLGFPRDDEPWMRLELYRCLA